MTHKAGVRSFVLTPRLPPYRGFYLEPNGLHGKKGYFLDMIKYVWRNRRS